MSTEFHFIQEHLKEMERLESSLEVPVRKGNYSERMLQPEADELEIALASITPLLGNIGEKCRSQSELYLTGLFSGELWAKKSNILEVLAGTLVDIIVINFSVFNSNGKMPNGMMAYQFDQCTADSQFVQFPCGYDDRIYPVGHQISMGSFSVSIIIQNQLGWAIYLFKNLFEMQFFNRTEYRPHEYYRLKGWHDLIFCLAQ